MNAGRWGWLASAVLLSGCAYPTEQVRTLDERPSLQVVGAPAGAVLAVDGVAVATLAAALPDQPADAVRLQPGTHVIEVVAGGRSLLRERMYLGGGAMRTVTVPAAGTP